MSSSIAHHASAVALAVDPDGPLVGLLLLGNSGAGKSLLALAAIETCPYRRSVLIADDVVEITERSGRLVAAAPPSIRGLIEIRGFGVVPCRSAREQELLFGADLSAPSERMPDPRRFALSPCATPSIPIFPFGESKVETTAAHRLRWIGAAILSRQSAQRAQDTD